MFQLTTKRAIEIECVGRDENYEINLNHVVNPGMPSSQKLQIQDFLQAIKLTELYLITRYFKF